MQPLREVSAFAQHGERRTRRQLLGSARHRVDDQCVAVPMTDRIAEARRPDIVARRMLAPIRVNVAHLIVLPHHQGFFRQDRHLEHLRPLEDCGETARAGFDRLRLVGDRRGVFHAALVRSLPLRVVGRRAHELQGRSQLWLASGCAAGDIQIPGRALPDAAPIGQRGDDSRPGALFRACIDDGNIRQCEQRRACATGSGICSAA